MSRLTKEQLSLETDNTKYCTKCKEIKPLVEFGSSKKGRKFASTRCTECSRKQAKEIGIRRHGITLQDYDKMFAEQNGKCKICGTEKVGNKQCGRFLVDHDHKTDKIRGLLCQSCNVLLGQAKDDTEILMSAVQYLMDTREP